MPNTAVNLVPPSSEGDLGLSDFSLAVLKDRYLLPGETPHDLFRRISSHYGDNLAHSQRLYQYLVKNWFRPATPILSNGGTNRGLPVSCFLNSVEDSIDGIYDLYKESALLAKHGGGLGSYWGKVRSMGSPVGDTGTSSGIIPFLKTLETSVMAVSQGNVRRGAGAAYLTIDHPEIEEFLDIRRPTGADPYRRTPSLHHGVVITDAFMEAVAAGAAWDLIDPHTQKVVRSISARTLFERLVMARAEWGEPYVLFIDTVNLAIPEFHAREGLTITQSNLCTEILLPTSANRTAICCLSSLNLRTLREWYQDDLFVEDVMRFLDNVIEDFIGKASDIPGFEKAVASAKAERSVGLGVMGFHSFLQSESIPFESALAVSWNKKIFSWLHQASEKATQQLATERGPCPDAAKYGVPVRNAYRLAVAPTASISILANSVSPSVEPYNANLFIHKTSAGAFTVLNPELVDFLDKKGLNREAVWTSIRDNRGSVQQLDCLDEYEKAIFKTSIEIDQRWVIDHAADRAPFIDQGQSINLFYPADVSKVTLTEDLFRAWRKGVKSLYYNRSRTEHQATTTASRLQNYLKSSETKPDTEECLACQ